jgi:hypothetical protein
VSAGRTDPVRRADEARVEKPALRPVLSISASVRTLRYRAAQTQTTRAMSTWLRQAAGPTRPDACGPVLVPDACHASSTARPPGIRPAGRLRDHMSTVCSNPPSTDAFTRACADAAVTRIRSQGADMDRLTAREASGDQARSRSGPSSGPRRHRSACPATGAGFAAQLRPRRRSRCYERHGHSVSCS